jgi:hypothetical protein
MWYLNWIKPNKTQKCLTAFCRFVKSNLNKINSVVPAMLVMTMAILIGGISNFD